MKLKDWVIGAMAFAALSGLIMAGVNNTRDIEPGPTPVNEGILGSASSPSVSGGCMEVEGLKTCYYEQSFRVATTTVCSYTTGSATTTLKHSAFRPALGSTTAMLLTVGYGPRFTNATTTKLYSGYTTVNSATALLATTSQDTWIIPPNQTINFNISRGDLASSAVGLAYTGLCTLEIMEI